MPPAFFDDNYVQAVQPTASPDVVDKRTRFARDLKGFGLEDYEVTILVEKFVNDNSFSQIAKKHGFVSKQAVHWLYNTAMKKVRQVYGLKKDKRN